MLYSSSNPRGIVLQTSSKPWGKWPRLYVIFDPFEDKGYGYFIHWPGRDKLNDEGVEEGPEGEYAPGLIEAYFTAVSNERSLIYFTMSTWNPYLLMSAEISKRYSIDKLYAIARCQKIVLMVVAQQIVVNI
jgi:hypothetical protein